MIEHLQQGSSDAFQALFDHYGKKIYTFSMGYLSDPFEAEEIVQEVFIKIWSIRKELSTSKSFDSFIFTIAKNAILNTIRKTKYQQAYLAWAQLNPQKNILLEEEIDFHELERNYRRSVERLSPRRKEIFLLSRENNLSNAEIATHLGISVKTVENQMTSALAEIKKHLKSNGFSGLFFFELFL